MGCTPSYMLQKKENDKQLLNKQALVLFRAAEVLIDPYKFLVRDLR